MTTLFTYTTPKKFAADFFRHYANDNLKQVQILSGLFLFISISIRIAYFTVVNSTTILNYDVYSRINWIQMGGTSTFLILSSVIQRYFPRKYNLKRIITIIFILFLLLLSLTVSYTYSLHNTKNNLMMFMIGIVTVSLFFSLELFEILIVSVFITIYYWYNILYANISINDKAMNIFAGFVLGFILYSFSRYSYYFKSQHFVRLKMLEEKNREVEKLHTQQGEILGFVAHDLRSPLNNIEAMSTLLYEEDKKEELKIIINATAQSKNIINDLIEAIRKDENKPEMTFFELNIFLTGIVEKWQKNLGRKISLQLPQETVPVFANASRLERAFDNIISNAIKFSADDKDIRISMSVSHPYIRIEIKDEGIGIPEDLMPNIFNQFSKSGRIGLKGEKSLGLGLHIAKRIMLQHEGELLVESVENEGTTFTILLPLKKA